jgi:hypothetical protein
LGGLKGLQWNSYKEEISFSRSAEKSSKSDHGGEVYDGEEEGEEEEVGEEEEEGRTDVGITYERARANSTPSAEVATITW